MSIDLILMRWIMTLFVRPAGYLSRWLARLWPGKTELLIIIASTLAVVMVAGIITVIFLHGFAPESAALLVAWATIVGVVVTQVVAASLASDRAQNDTLQAYLEKMGDLLTDKGLHSQTKRANDEVRASARAQTLVTFRRIGAEHKQILLQFLYDSSLINRETATSAIPPENPVISLREAHLVRGYLRKSNLRKVDLSESQLQLANLKGANLSEANLSNAEISLANLRGAILKEAQLNRANLYGANLCKATLSKADLSLASIILANLRGANLSDSKLSETTSIFTNLREADLSNADLSKAKLTTSDLSSSNLS